MTPKPDIEPVATLVERLKAGAARFKGITDAPTVIYTVPGATDRLAILRDDVLMAQYRLEEAASALLALEGERDARDELLGRAAVNMPQGAREVEFLPENIMFLRRRAEAAEAEVARLKAAQ
jgi:hypothetical protein